MFAGFSVLSFFVSSFFRRGSFIRRTALIGAAMLTFAVATVSAASTSAASTVTVTIAMVRAIAPAMRMLVRTHWSSLLGPERFPFAGSTGFAGFFFFIEQISE